MLTTRLLVRGLPVAALAALLLTMTGAAPSGRAIAQDPDQKPNYGSKKLKAGAPAIRLNVTAGGNVQANKGDLRQWVSNAPDFSLDFTAGDGPLTIRAESKADTTLLVLGPDGRWLSDDDSGGFPNPLIKYQRPRSGRYDVWVGTLRKDLSPQATLIIEAPTTTGPNPELKPNFGSKKLTAGFTPDPFEVRIVAGGNVQSDKGNLKQWVSRSPDFVLDYTAGSFPLTIHAKSKDDTTLLVNLPDGSWLADDDSGGFPNPLIKIQRPRSGRYAIWLGTLQEGKSANATLYITELEAKK